MQFIDRKICMTKIDGIILCVIILTLYKNGKHTAYFDNMHRYGTDLNIRQIYESDSAHENK